MLRNIENIFPEWHSHPMDYASLHDWYDDVISAIQSIAEMKEEILHEDCPYRREAKATYTLERIQNKVGEEMAQFYVWLRHTASVCQEEQQEDERQREAMRDEVEAHIAREQTHRRKAFERQLAKDMDTLRADLFAGRVLLTKHPKNTQTPDVTEFVTCKEKEANAVDVTKFVTCKEKGDNAVDVTTPERSSRLARERNFVTCKEKGANVPDVTTPERSSRLARERNFVTCKDAAPVVTYNFNGPVGQLIQHTDQIQNDYE